MNEHHEREEAAGQRAGGNEIARDRLAEDRQAVEQLRTGEGDILGEPVPHEPIAGNARTVEQPDHRQAGEPGKPADAAVLIVGELPQQVGCDHYHHKVGSITVKAAHHACVKPLFAADVFDRLVSAFDAGIEENEKIDTAAGNDPEKEEAERTKLSERIERRPEQSLERPLNKFKPAP